MTLVARPPCDEAVLGSGQPFVPCPPQHRAWVLAVTVLGSSMVFIEGSAVSVALPSFQRALDASVVDIQWIVNAYTLFLAALLLPGGSLGDRFGRKRVFLIGLILFTLASATCGLARDATELIFARAVQGIGGALLTPGSLAILSASFPERERGRAIGLWSGFTAITTAFGPVLAGWLIDSFSWRWIFFINVPLAVLVVLLALRFVPESRGTAAEGRLDVAGATLGTLGLVGVTYGLLESSERGLGDSRILGALAGGSIFLVAFLMSQARSRAPMMPLELFRSRSFSGANLLTLLLYAALGGAFFFLPINLVQVQGYTSTQAGAAFLPFILLMGVLSRWSGGLVSRYGAMRPLVLGTLIAAAGFALFALPDVGGSYWATFFPAILTLGLGMALSVAPLTTTVMNAVPEQHVGTGSGINNAVSRVASLLAVAVFGIIMLTVFGSALADGLREPALPAAPRGAILARARDLAALSLPQELPAALRPPVEDMIRDAFVRGFRVVMLVAAALAAASAVVAWRTIGTRPPHESARTAGA